MKKISDCIQPLGWKAAHAPGGQSFISWLLVRDLGNTNRGGIYEPAALKHTSMVTVLPLSADDSTPTCFLPLSESIFDLCLGTTVTPVSSQLKILSAVNLWVSTMRVSKVKKFVTLGLLKAAALAALVDSGFLRES